MQRCLCPQEPLLTPGDLGLSRPEHAPGASAGSEALLVDQLLAALQVLVGVSSASCSDARTVPLLADVAVDAARAIAVGFPVFFGSAWERYDALAATVSAAAIAARSGEAWEYPLLDCVCTAMSSPLRLAEVLPGKPWATWAFGDTEKSVEVSTAAYRAAFDASLAKCVAVALRALCVADNFCSCADRSKFLNLVQTRTV